MLHVSQLKQHIGKVVVQSTLPLLDTDGLLVKEPVQILERRMQKAGNVAVTEVLVQWSNTFPEDATWENLKSLQQRFPQFHS